MHLHFGLPVGPGTQLPVIFVTFGPWNTLSHFSLLLYLSSSFLPAPFMHLHFWAACGPRNTSCPLFEFVTAGPWNSHFFSSPLPLLSSSFLPTPFMHFLGRFWARDLPTQNILSLLGPGITLLQFTNQFIPHFLLHSTCSLHAFAFWSACGPGTSLPQQFLSLLGPGMTLFSVFFSFITSPLFLLPIYSIPAFAFWAVCGPGPTQLSIYRQFLALE
jgi:hypothetical protein